MCACILVVVNSVRVMSFTRGGVKCACVFAFNTVLFVVLHPVTTLPPSPRLHCSCLPLIGPVFRQNKKLS